MSVTRIFQRRPEVLHDRPANEQTAFFENPLLRPQSPDDPFDPRSLFIERYAIIKNALGCHRRQGILLLAFDDQRSAVGQVWLKASLDRARSTIIGRHSMCGLALPAEHADLSLRHVALVSRAVSHTEARIRIIDLHTPIGFRDEAGRVLQGVTSEGPMFFALGKIIIMVLLTDESSPIPDDPEDAYACIPERVFVEERYGTAGAQPRKVSGPNIAPGITAVRSRLGPVAAVRDLCLSDETPLGTLVVRGKSGSVQRPVGPSALERGILIGRYERCEIGAVDHPDSELSRVHLLIVRDGDQVLAIDTATTNGTTVNSRAVLLAPMEDGVAFDLAGELEVCWHSD